MGMMLHGAQPRPRALLEELPSSVADAMEARVGSARRVQDGEEVDESEYDLLVTTRAVVRSSHLHVLALGSEFVRAVRVANIEPETATFATHSVTPRPRAPFVNIDVVSNTDVLSKQLGIPDRVRGTLQGLVNDTLVPVVKQLPRRPRWGHSTSFGYTSYNRSFLAGVTPLLTTHDPDVLLAFQAERRRPENAEPRFVVALPVMPNHPERWLDWFLTFLREHAPSAFPERTAWREDALWSPPELRTALIARAALEDRRRAMLAELERDAAQIEVTVATQTKSAEESVWRLVTAQGAELEAAVAAALSALGFVVEERDAQVAPGQPKLEDLRLTDPAAPGWVALVEIKGFEKGASPKGVVQLMTRAQTAYIKETTQTPGAVYYVVNHELNTPPDERPEALRGDSAIDMLAGADGAFLDTRDLLRAHLAVLENPSTADDVRASIRASRGRWTHTTPDVDEAATVEA